MAAAYLCLALGERMGRELGFRRGARHEAIECDLVERLSFVLLGHWFFNENRSRPCGDDFGLSCKS